MNNVTSAPVIIDNGSCFIKAGLAGRYQPACVIPAVVGRPKAGDSNAGSIIYMGAEALNKSDVLDLSRPVSSSLGAGAGAGAGTVPGRWGDIAALWRHIFTHDLCVDPEGKSVLMLVGAPTTKADLEKIIQILFSELGVAKFCVVSQAHAALYLSGKETGCVVDVGYNEASITPIYEGAIMLNAIMRTSYADKKQVDGFPASLFSALGEQDDSLQQTAYASIMKCNVDIRKDLLSHVVLSGGNSVFDGMDLRLANELKSLDPAVEVNVVSSPQREFSSWLGAAKMTELPSFENRWISKQEYDESGPAIVHRCSPLGIMEL
jgi:actin-related protein